MTNKTAIPFSPLVALLLFLFTLTSCADDSYEPHRHSFVYRHDSDFPNSTKRYEIYEAGKGRDFANKYGYEGIPINDLDKQFVRVRVRCMHSEYVDCSICGISKYNRYQNFSLDDFKDSFAKLVLDKSQNKMVPEK